MSRTKNRTTGKTSLQSTIGYECGVNLYGFVGNDPVNGGDYLGLRWWWPPSWFRGDKIIDGEEILDKRSFVEGTDMTFSEWDEVRTAGLSAGYYVYEVDFEAEVEGQTKYIDCCTKKEKNFKGNLFYKDSIASDERAATDQPIYIVLTGNVGIGIFRYTLRGLITKMVLPDAGFVNEGDARNVARLLENTIPTADPSKWEWRGVEFSGCD